MDDLKAFLNTLYKNLHILQQREAKYAGNAPLELSNQIDDHRTAIELTKQAVAGKMIEAEWREQLRPLLVNIEEHRATEEISVLNIDGVNFSDISGSTITTGDITSTVTDGGDVIDGDKVTQMSEGNNIAQASHGGRAVSYDERGQQVYGPQYNVAGDMNVYPPSQIETNKTEDEDPAPGESPYKGLLYFDMADANLFFGRKNLTAKLVSCLKEHNFLAVVGASGSGKSSLARAGLVAVLKYGEPLAGDIKPPKDSPIWQYHVFTPTAHPLKELAASLTRGSESIRDTRILMDDLAEDARSLDLAIHRRLSDSPAQHLLLLVDQFEEVFTLCKDETERRAFVDNLVTAVAEPDGPTSVVITLRADFYAHCGQYEQLRLLLETQQVYIGSMNLTELRTAIEQPAKQADWDFEPGLVDLLLADVGNEPGALPLLSHALLETWKQRRGRTMTLAGYAQAGRVQGAIAKTAGQVYQELKPEEQPIARNIFLRLTELGEGTQDTRRRVTLDELILSPELRPQVEGVLKTLSDARLISTSSITGAEEKTEMPRIDATEMAFVEVAHEALIREWPLLRKWLDKDREALHTHRRLTEAALEWKQNEHDPSYLYRGNRLEQAETWAESAENLNELEQAFLQASMMERNRLAREKEEQRQREVETAQKLAKEAEARRKVEEARAKEQTKAATRLRRLARWLTVAIGVALLLMVAAGLFGIQSRRNATRAEANEVVANARTLLETDPELSILLLETISGTQTSQAEALLQQAIQTSRIRYRFTLTNPVRSVAFSPDGDRLAAGDDEGQVKVWEITSGQEVMSIVDPNGEGIWSVSFSPDGTYLAVAGANDAVEIWDIASGRLMTRKQGHSRTVRDVVFCSGDQTGPLMATASGDETVKIWSLEEADALMTLTSHKDNVVGVAFSPNCDRLVSASEDGTAIIWDVVSGKERHIVTGHDGAVLDMAFNPNGTQFATSSEDRTVKIWDMESGEEMLTLPETSAVRGVAFSPNGTRLATANVDGTARTWNVITGRPLLTFAGHTDAVQDVAFSPDGTQLATAGLDGSVRVWDASGHGDAATDVAFSPDGNWLVTTGWDGAIRVWQVFLDKNKSLLDIRESSAPIAANNGPIRRVAFSPDGNWLATASHDRMARLWPWPPDSAANSIPILETITGTTHLDRVQGVAFSLNNDDPNQMWLATTSYDKTAKLWHLILNRDEGSGISQRQHILEGHESWVNEVAFSPDGTLLATASSDRTARVWDTGSGKLLYTLNDPDIELGSVSFSPDGTRLATAGINGAAKVWDIESEKIIFDLKGHTNWVRDITFSPDGMYLATAGYDETTRVWDANTGQIVITLNNDTQVESVAFSPDGTLLATADGEGTLHLYPFPWKDSDMLQDLARRRVTRKLTDEECESYLPRQTC